MQQHNIYPKGMSAQELKRKVLAFEALFDTPASVTVRGDWYGPIDGDDSPPFSIHNNGKDFRVCSIGRKYIEIELSEQVNKERHKVLISERRGNGADRITIKASKSWIDTVKINGKRKGRER